ncbi:MAG: MbtH family NRPS accessory protein [Rhodospirillum sp.]|nr:MbtH family NRPS accessory protein [Rhodospirillum sp.]MCF8489239.1 MbtH family NRPS accessory protein [Rhodospirillum sp.]MCF8500524.1 MbtH family NRPS accessory protein [Rhodospirillum sp.]
MLIDAESTEPTHSAFLNDEDPRCIGPAGKPPPLGWHKIFSGSQEECLAHFKRIWTDIRPKSVRE